MNLPNRLTLFRIACVPVYLVLLGLQTPVTRWIAFVVFSIAALTDLLDGRIARARDQVTNFGKLMDPIADKLLVIPALILMIETGDVAAWMAIVFVAREFLISGLRLIAVEQGTVIAAGIWGKAKTVVQIIAVMLLTVQIPALYIPTQIALWGALLLTVWSCVDYFYKGRDLWLKGRGA